jgi:hypothetical protein
LLAAITRIDLARAVRAHGPDDPVLQHAQQLGLKLHWHLADLVEEDRSAIGRAEQSVPRPRGTGESAALVAEHLRLQQLMRNRRAVDRHEGAPAPCRQVVDRPRDDLLAGAALARDQNGRIGRGYAIDQCPKFDDRCMLADKAAFGGRPRTGIGLGLGRGHCLPVPQ